jgi:DNA-binding NarL/FixJ family response regulator
MSERCGYNTKNEVDGLNEPTVLSAASECCLKGGAVYLGELNLTERRATANVRCLVVDDHALLRQGVRRLLEDQDGVEVIGEANNAADALEQVITLRPDVVLMDIGMPGVSSFDVARVIQAEYPATRVVFLTMHEDQDYVMQGLQAGAAGYVLKDTPAEKLASVLRDVHGGGKYVSPEVLNGLLLDESDRQAEMSGSNKPTLTPRETEVMKLLAQGHTVRKIAGMLGVSMKTVDAHKFNLMRKLDIHNKAELVHCAIRNKLVKVAVGN